jgi:FSR family fosmidomycin resistance protein-like MFS transporter
MFWTGVLSVIIGLVLASAFAAILVYAQDLVPGKVGTISGLLYGLALGMGGIAAAVLGTSRDQPGRSNRLQIGCFGCPVSVLASTAPDRCRQPACRSPPVPKLGRIACQD